jgi:hypothetical protein
MPAEPSTERTRTVRAGLFGAVLGLVLGAVAGGAWADHLARQADEAQRDRALAVVTLATADDVTATPEGVVVDLTVQVVNQGPAPVAVIPTVGREPAFDRPVVDLGDRPATVGRSAEASVAVRLLLRCPFDGPMRAQVPIRTPDGRRHDVPVRLGVSADGDGGRGGGGGGSGATLTGASLCRNAPARRLDARLTGTLDRPTLTLTNGSADPAIVTLDSGSTFTQASSAIFSLATRPALPIRLGPGQRRRLTLDLRVQNCDGGPAGRSGSVGVIGLSFDSPTSGDMLGSTTVDLTTLLSPAARRTCPTFPRTRPRFSRTS